MRFALILTILLMPSLAIAVSDADCISWLHEITPDYYPGEICNLVDCEIVSTPDVFGNPTFTVYELVYYWQGRQFSIASCISNSGSNPPPTSLPPIDTTKSPVCPANSSINMDSLALNETIPLVGVPFNLNYASDRMRPTSHFSPLSIGLGGWMPTFVHHYDAADKLLYYGNGGIRNIEAVPTPDGYYATDEDGTEVYYFDSAGHHLETRDALTGVVKYSFTYDSNGRLSTISDRFNNTTTFTPSDTGSVITSPYGQATVLTFDSNGFLASVTNPNNETYRVTNDSSGYMTAFQKPNGQKSSVSYDSNGYVTQDLGAGGDSLNLLQSFNSSTGMQTVSSSTTLNRTTTFEASGDAASSTHLTKTPTGARFSEKDVLNGRVSRVDSYSDVFQASQAPDPRFGWLAPIQQSSTFMVPNSNVLISKTENISATLSDQNDPFSFSTLTTTTTIQNDSARTFTSVYDNSNKSLVQISPLNRKVKQMLNPSGQLASLQLASLNPVSFSYDSHGRVVSVQQGQRTSSFTYDPHSNIATSTDPLGRVTRYQYDNANRMTLEALPDGNEIAMTYDSIGDMTSLTPPGKTAHTFSYNLFDYLQQYLPPSLGASLSGATTYAYNLDKQLTQVNRPDGTQIKYSYDPTTGLLQKISVPSGDYTFNYVPMSDHVSSVTSPDNETSSYTYAGEFVTKNDWSGVLPAAIQYSYNSDGSLQSIMASSQSGPVQIDFGYDNDGLLTQAGDETIARNNFGAVAGTSLKKISEHLDYNGYGEIEEDSIKIGKRRLVDHIYSRDNLGRIVSIKTDPDEMRDHDRDHDHEFPHNEMSFQYDSRSRLIKAWGPGEGFREYKYDANGNRIEEFKNGHVIRTEYDSQDRLIKYGNTEYVYNANGERIQKIERADDGDRDDDHYIEQRRRDRITNYSYDAFGNLKSVTLPDGKIIEYILDGENRRVGKKVNGQLVAGYIYDDQSRIIAETDGQGHVTQAFVYGSKSNAPDYVVQDGQEYKIISNQVGTPEMIVDPNRGNIIQRYRYDEFGVPLERSHRHSFPFGFAGGLYDLQTGLVHFGARDYDPVTGRWTSKDPILFNGGDTNLYGYVLGDPVNGVDPSGKQWISIPDAIIGWCEDNPVKCAKSVSWLWNLINGKKGPNLCNPLGGGNGSCNPCDDPALANLPSCRKSPPGCDPISQCCVGQ